MNHILVSNAQVTRRILIWCLFDLNAIYAAFSC